MASRLLSCDGMETKIKKLFDLQGIGELGVAILEAWVIKDAQRALVNEMAEVGK